MTKSSGPVNAGGWFFALCAIMLAYAGASFLLWFYDIVRLTDREYIVIGVILLVVTLFAGSWNSA